MAITRIQPGTINARAVKHGNTVYLSGLTADDKKLDIVGQTKQVLAKIDAILTEAGSDKTKLLSAVVVLSDIKNREAMNAPWKEWLNGTNLPARMAHQGALGTPDTLVEIMVTAATD
jgi:enamine deaminase RidA (YjgF/YER057c/UK114 family)